jgi:hypothetical protein
MDENPRIPQGNRRRLAVSAEVGKFRKILQPSCRVLQVPDENEAANYNRVVIPKSDVTQKALR